MSVRWFIVRLLTLSVLVINVAWAIDDCGVADLGKVAGDIPCGLRLALVL